LLYFFALANQVTWAFIQNNKKQLFFTQLVVTLGMSIDGLFVEFQPIIVWAATLVKGESFGAQVGDYVNICRSKYETMK